MKSTDLVRGQLLANGDMKVRDVYPPETEGDLVEVDVVVSGDTLRLPNDEIAGLVGAEMAECLAMSENRFRLFFGVGVEVKS